MGNDNHITFDREFFERATKRAGRYGANTLYDAVVFLEKEIEGYREKIDELTAEAKRTAQLEAKPKKELKPLNTKIFVLDGDDVLKSSHIYEIENGKILTFCGVYPFAGTLYTMNDVINYLKPLSRRNDEEKYDSNGEEFSVYNSLKQITVMEVKEG